jgi:hypothetical protein
MTEKHRPLKRCTETLSNLLDDMRNGIIHNILPEMDRGAEKAAADEGNRV